MKTTKNYLLILVTGLFFILISPAVIADDPPPPTQHGETGDIPAGGGAPIGEGVFILSLLASAYGARKAYRNKKELMAD